MNNKLGENMLKEINEIKPALLSTINNIKKGLNCNLPKKFKKSFNRIHILACGTSYNAGLIGKTFIEKNLNIPCEVTIASELNKDNYYLNKKTLYVFISQSGTTTDVLNALAIIQSLKLKSLSITNNLNSILHNKTNYQFPISAGEEIAIASTKAFNCQILNLLLLSKRLLLKPNKYIAYCNKLENKIIKTNFNFIEKNYLNLLKNLLINKTSCYITGKNLDYCYAREFALKIKETCYIDANAIELMEIAHGPIASLNENLTIILINTNKNNIDNINKIIKKLQETNSNIILLTSIKESKYKINNTEIIKIKNVKFPFNTIYNIIPMQQAAHIISISMNLNPDKPKLLTKSVI